MRAPIQPTHQLHVRVRGAPPRRLAHLPSGTALLVRERGTPPTPATTSTPAPRALGTGPRNIRAGGVVIAAFSFHLGCLCSSAATR
jgi:hypothetical protein